jgi:hypothetical protein
MSLKFLLFVKALFVSTYNIFWKKKKNIFLIFQCLVRLKIVTNQKYFWLTRKTLFNFSKIVFLIFFLKKNCKPISKFELVLLPHSLSYSSFSTLTGGCRKLLAVSSHCRRLPAITNFSYESNA